MSLHAAKCCHLVNAHTTSSQHLCSSARQLPIYSTFVVVIQENGQQFKNIGRQLCNRMHRDLNSGCSVDCCIRIQRVTESTAHLCLCTLSPCSNMVCITTVNLLLNRPIHRAVLSNASSVLTRVIFLLLDYSPRIFNINK